MTLFTQDLIECVETRGDKAKCKCKMNDKIIGSTCGILTLLILLIFYIQYARYVTSSGVCNMVT